MELLMSRYILEIEKDTSLFKRYGNGWYPNFDKYRRFLHKQEKNNQSFSKLILRYRLIRKNEHLIETVMSKDLDSISTFLNMKSTKIESGYGTIYLPKPTPPLEYPSCYISNGFYHDTKDIALQMVGCGSFIIGVCDKEDSIFYQENIEKIKEFTKILKKKHIPYHIYKHSNHRDKCYALAYRSDTK